MSETTRYRVADIQAQMTLGGGVLNGGILVVDPAGPIVAYGAYAKLQAENERLRKAGDDLYKSMFEIGCNEMADNFEYDRWWGSMKAWNAAKEGQP